MTFLAPLVLAGLAAVAAPIALHLIKNMRVRHVKWAAMRFLEEAVRKNERRLRVEDLLLLLVRCALVVLLVLAFAKPVLNPGGLDARFDSAAKVAVVALDTSASMGQSDGARTRLDLAKAAANRYLDSLGPGSRAALITAGGGPPRLGSAPSADTAAVRRSIEAARPAAGANDWADVLPPALEALKPFEGARREVVIFTDNQASGWARLADIREVLEPAPDISVRILPLGGAGENNTSIVSLKPESLVPAANQPFGILVEVANFGRAPVPDVRVTLAIDRDPPSDEQMIPLIAPGTTEVVRLQVRFNKPGFHTVTAAIPADRLPADDARTLAVQVVEEVRVTVVENLQSGRARDRDGFFVSNALVPVSPDKQAEFFLKVRSEPPAWLESGPLESEAVVFLMNPSAISASAAERLRAYVEAGGALVIFPGPATDPKVLNDAFNDWLPAALGPARDDSADPAGWQTSAYTHPVTALWNTPASGSLGSIRSSRHFPLTLPKDAGTDGPKAVVTYSGGDPAVAEAQRGKGFVVLFSTSTDPAWSNLGIHPNFVPLLRRLVGHVSTTAAAQTLLVAPGEVFQKRLPPEAIGRNVTLQSPGFQTPRAAGQVVDSEGEGLVTIRGTETAGGYRVAFEGSDVPVATFAVQVPPAESNLAIQEGDPLHAASGSVAGDKRAAPAIGTRRELWGALLLAAGLLAIVEMILAHRFSFAK